MSFAARYEGTCATCGDRINVDDMIRYNADDEVVHTRHQIPEEKLAPPCTSCFMIHAGECF